MNKDLVIFGIGKIAEVIFYYATKECGFNVMGFCVDEPYKDKDQFNGLPVVSFKDVEHHFPASSHNMFIGIGYHDLNRLREARCNDAIKKGYKLVSVISPLTNVPANVKIGYNCFIMPPAVIHPCVSIQNNVFIWNAALVAHHTTIEDNCWLTSGCNVSGNVHIGSNCFLAVNSTIGHSVNIGKNCFIGANALVTKNLEDEKVVIVESTKSLRLTSDQFLKMSGFSSL